MTDTVKPITTSPSLFAVAGSATATITSAYYTYGAGPQPILPVNLPVNQPSSGAWVGQDPQTLQWFVVNMPLGTVGVYINGQLVTSWIGGA
ncbi:MAG: hypothetical protein ACKOE2_14800 [Actinomycetales bacterium]